MKSKIIIVLALLCGMVSPSFATEIFFHDNFNKEHNNFDVTNLSAGTISFHGGAKVFNKSGSHSWSNFGQVAKSANVRTLQAGDTFEFKFKPVTFNSGDPEFDGSATFWQLGLLLDNATLRGSGYGLYLEGNAFRAIHYNGVDPGNDFAVDTDKTYVLTLVVLENSDLDILIREHGDDSDTELLEFPGPFIDRDAYIYFDLWSDDTVNLIDIKGSNPNN